MYVLTILFFSTQMKTVSIDLFMPDKTKLVAFLQNELSTDFGEATVKWVDCPDLTQKPFNLAAPGLCGDTALFDIGGMSNLFPLPKREKIFYFKTILQELNRTQSNNFIIGGGLCEKQSDEHLGELIMNASFSPGGTKVKNKSRFASLHPELNLTDKFVLEPLTDTNPNCNLYGNFFVSNGLREQVLKVQTKKQFGRSFIDALQHAISRFPKTDSQLIGFGGTFIVKNGETRHHVIRNKWFGEIKNRNKILKHCIQYWNAETPVIAFATFVNADRHVVKMNPGLEEIFLTPSHAHACSDHVGGHYHGTELSENDTTEYLGYFSSATKLYRIDPVPIFHELASFSNL